MVVFLRSASPTFGPRGCSRLHRCPARAGPGGSVDITSDYVLRGVSQSNGKAAWQGDAHWNFPAGWTAGVWASQVELLPQQDSWELDSYLQWHGALSPDVDLGASATYYSYPSDPRSVDYDYSELSVSMTLARPDPGGGQLDSRASRCIHTRTAWPATARSGPWKASWHRDLPARLDLTAGVGFYYPPGLDYASYAYGDATLGWKYGHWRVNLAWIWAQNADPSPVLLGPAAVRWWRPWPGFFDRRVEPGRPGPGTYRCTS